MSNLLRAGGREGAVHRLPAVAPADDLVEGRLDCREVGARSATEGEGRLTVAASEISAGGAEARTGQVGATNNLAVVRKAVEADCPGSTGAVDELCHELLQRARWPREALRTTPLRSERSQFETGSQYRQEAARHDRRLPFD